MMHMNNKINKNIVLVCLILFFLFSPVQSMAAAQVYRHNTAGFSINIPPGWDIDISLTGLELSRPNALLSLENLGVFKDGLIDVMNIFIPKDIGNFIKIKQPYPGLRTKVDGQGYAAEIAILCTPFGYFLLSLEQKENNRENLKLFEQMLKDFTLLEIPPFDADLNPLHHLTFSNIDLNIPNGEPEIDQNSFILNISDSGLIMAEIVTGSTSQSLKVILDNWSNDIFLNAAGLEKKTSELPLFINSQKAIIANYTGPGIQARVHALKINNKTALLLGLITHEQTFKSHEQALDVISFSFSSLELPLKNEPAPRSKPVFTKADYKIYKKLRSGIPDNVRAAAKYLYKGQYRNPELLNIAATILKRGYKKNKNKTHIDAMAWLCKALGKSGKKKYLPLLNRVAKTSLSRKLKGYAKKSARQLQ